MRDIELAIAAAVDPLLDELVKCQLEIEALKRTLAEAPAPKPGPAGVGIEAPGWEPRVYREGAIVTHYLGQYFKALQDTADEPGDSGHWQRLGFAGFRWRGVKEDGMELRPGDQFLEASSCFLVDHTGAPRLINYRGERGARGKEGPPGKPGPAAAAFSEDALEQVVQRLIDHYAMTQIVPTLGEVGERLVSLERGRP